MNLKIVNKLAPAIKKAGLVLGEHSPSILLGVGIAGVVTTIVLTAKATKDANTIVEKNINMMPDPRDYKYHIEEEDRAIFNQKQYKKDWLVESTKLTWKCYIPVVISGTATIAAFVSGHVVQKKRIGALALLYSGALKSAEEYQDKVKELFGASKDEKVRGELAQDRVNAHPVDKENVILTHHGDTLCLDSLSGRYFKSDINFIKSAINEFNEELIKSSCMTLNELYQVLDLDPISLGDYIGWNSGTIVSVRYDSALTFDQTPCLVINFVNPPMYEYIPNY